MSWRHCAGGNVEVYGVRYQFICIKDKMLRMYVAEASATQVGFGKSGQEARWRGGEEAQRDGSRRIYKKKELFRERGTIKKEKEKRTGFMERFKNFLGSKAKLWAESPRGAPGVGSARVWAPDTFWLPGARQAMRFLPSREPSK